MRAFNKVFVISLPRCATVSMCDGLGRLGVRLAHLGKIYGEETPPHNDPQRLAEMHAQISEGNFDLDILKLCDGLIDYPACIPTVFEALDRQFPGSLFINVRRDHNVDAWLRSVERQFVGLQLIKMGAESTETDREFMQVMRSFRAGTFGQAEFDADVYRQSYQRHQQLIATYFAGREADLLDFEDISVLEMHGYEMLGRFLECDTPAALFPRVNDHSDAPRLAFLKAVREGRIQSQTGIKVEL